MESLHTLGYMLQHVTDALTRRIDQTLQEQLGIGWSQYRILMSFEQITEHTQREIAAYLAQTEAGISRQIKILEQKGIIATKINPKNRREHLCYLTPKGLKFAAAAEHILQKILATALADVSERQQKQVFDVLQKTHDKLCTADPLAVCKSPYVHKT